MISECVCRSDTYEAVDGTERACLRCPLGARCSDGSCALASNPIACPATSDSVVGDWTQGSDGVFILASCPSGHSLMNSLDGTSSGEFFQELQQCRQCDEVGQYILDPNRDS